MNKMHIINLDDPQYPSLLKNIHDAPKVLYVNGEFLEKDKRALAIVGTRAATRSGLEIAEKLAFQLASLGFTIVSGLAAGVDTAAHRGALKAGGRTLAVFGTGLDRIFPAENNGLAQEILKNGAWVSELPPGQPPERWTFPRRNRIIAGLSIGTIVIEGGVKSGAMITAKCANDEGREVFAVPGNILHEQSKGPHWLIKNGAKLIEGVEDILEELEGVLQTKFHFAKNVSQEGGDIYPRLLGEVSDHERSILSLLSAEEMHIDHISSKAGLPPAEVSGILAILEIKGVIRQLPGKLFVTRP